MTRPARLTEAAWQRRVVDAARALGWRVAHFRPALTRSGRWATPMTGDAGFPDLVLARNGCVLLVELKTDVGRFGPGQPQWGDAIGPVHWRCWRPRDWPRVHHELTTLGTQRKGGCRV